MIQFVNRGVLSCWSTSSIDLLTNSVEHWYMISLSVKWSNLISLSSANPHPRMEALVSVAIPKKLKLQQSPEIFLMCGKIISISKSETAKLKTTRRI